MVEKEAVPRTFGSFAKTLAIYQKLTKMETALTTMIERSKVPASETRKLLRCTTVEQAENVPLYQYMRDMFNEIGFGDLRISSIDKFIIRFYVEDSPVAKLYDIKGKKTCYITADALAQFFTKDLGISSNVEEIKCVNAGDDFCEFEVRMQPLPVYQIALDDADKSILALIVKGKRKSAEIADMLGMDEVEVDYRLNILKNYHLIDDDYNPTEIGITYYQFGGKILAEIEEEFSPPWEERAKITQAISDALSFAEAVNEALGTETQEVLKENVINLAEEAKKSKSFAELLSKYMKKDEEGGE
ncbi:MAG: hypothetical protein DRN20_01680 [Thermoplasmata archaeon]|nr:MAG: hypothetical protein DRN20_01680 [Thermoplasmata archaeon]